MQTPILISPQPSTIVNSAARYIPLAAGIASSTATPRTPFAEAGTVSGLKVRLGAALTTGTLVVTFQLGTAGGVPADTAMTVSFSAGEQEKTYAGAAISVAAGNEGCVKFTPTSTPDIHASVQCSLIYEGTASGKGVIFAYHIATAAATFIGLGCGTNNATESNVIVVAPCDGVISKIYLRRSVAPGAGTSTIFTLRKGANVAGMADTALTATIADTAQSANGTSSVSVTAGDFLSIGVTITGSPASGIGIVGLDWTPTIDGEALLFGIANSNPSSTVDRYLPVNGLAPSATETDTYSVAPMAFTARKMRARVTTVAGGSASWTDTLRKGGASQALTCTFGAADTVQSDTTNSVSVATSDLINWLIDPTSSPTAYGAMTIGMVAFTGTAPAARTHRMTTLGVG